MKNFVEVTKFTAQFNPATETELPNIMLNWTLDESVESFELFKSIGDDTVSLGVFDAAMGIAQYKDEDIAVGTEYKYTIKAIKAGKVSTEKIATAKFPHAPLVAVEFQLASTYSDEGSFVTVTFSPVEFAENYEVYRKASSEEGWKKIATVKAEDISEEMFTFTDNDVDTEITYYYTVKAVASDRDSIYNEEGKPATVRVPVEPVAGIIAREEIIDDKTVAVITWDEVENGHYYEILRKTADTDWEFMSMVFAGDELKYVDNTIIQGVEYTYTIKVSAPLRGEATNEIGADFLWALPEEPDTPAEPDVPVDPEDPTEPDSPVDPENPDDSENIEVPENSDAPTVPDKPETEGVPDEPVEGEEIEGPSVEEIQ